MKKYIKFMAFAMMAVFSLTLVSCGDDDYEGESDFVGTWSTQRVEGWGYSVVMGDSDFEYMQLKSDGSYIDVKADEYEDEGYNVSYGKWSVSNNKLNLKVSTPSEMKGTLLSYEIINKGKNKMTLSMLGITSYLVKVSDSVIEKYLEDEEEDYDAYGPFNVEGKYQVININGTDYACYGYGCPETYSSTWEDDVLHVGLPMGKLSDAKKGEYDWDYFLSVSCYDADKPKAGTDLAKYPDVNIGISLDEDEDGDLVYVSGSAIVKSVKDDDYITIEFKNFKCKTGSTSYTINGTVKLDYDVD